MDDNQEQRIPLQYFDLIWKNSKGSTMFGILLKERKMKTTNKKSVNKIKKILKEVYVNKEKVSITVVQGGKTKMITGVISFLKENERNFSMKDQYQEIHILRYCDVIDIIKSSDE